MSLFIRFDRPSEFTRATSALVFLGDKGAPSDIIVSKPGQVSEHLQRGLDRIHGVHGVGRVGVFGGLGAAGKGATRERHGDGDDRMARRR